MMLPGGRWRSLRRACAFARLVWLIGLLMSCGRKENEASGAESTPTTAPSGILRVKRDEIVRAGIEVYPVTRGEFRLYREFPATVQPNANELAEVTSLIHGRVNVNSDGNVLARHAERAIVRGLGLVTSVADIENIVVKEAGGTPVFVCDVAEVRIERAMRHGAVVLNGEREVVAGIVFMLRGGNAREIVHAVKEKIETLHRGNALPGGRRIVPFYDRIELLTAAVNTVRDALIEGVSWLAWCSACSWATSVARSW